jgi:hypothetical protein
MAFSAYASQALIYKTPSQRNGQLLHWSPIILDLRGNGIHLTDVQNGIFYDLNGDGEKEQIAWTRSNSDDAWLVLDRDGNKSIDDGRELFGSFTEQPLSLQPNGFMALAELDGINSGGNGDGLIDSNDGRYGNLQLWRDLNHDGVSDANEIFSLAAMGIEAMDLHYEAIKNADQFGNLFLYRGRILSHNLRIGPWAYDVFLSVMPVDNN